ncbi:Slit-Robo Rho Gtpase-Activating Protein 3 [Manis pentadactyla]|nr:Slit-Robo Rho Gtpase-Activating Protein 3 [Manis pentadactyla]
MKRHATAGQSAVSRRSDTGAQSYCGGGSRSRCDPVLLPCRACGDGARGWREKGKSLGGRRAGPAASLSRGSGRADRSLCTSLRLGRAVRRHRARGCRCSPTPGPLTRRAQAAPGSGASRSGWGFGGRSLFRLAGRLAGKEGESGDTHSPRRARIAHSQPRAPAEVRPGHFGPAARPRHLPAPRAALGLWRNWSRQRGRPNAALVRPLLRARACGICVSDECWKSLSAHFVRVVEGVSVATEAGPSFLRGHCCALPEGTHRFTNPFPGAAVTLADHSGFIKQGSPHLFKGTS